MNKNKSSKKEIEKKDHPTINDILPTEEIINKLPPEEREKVKDLSFKLFRTSQISGSASEIIAWTLLEKCDKEQVTEIIRNAEKHNNRLLEDRKDLRRTKFKIFIISSIIFIIICALFLTTKNEEMLLKLLEILLIAAASGFGGWGIASKTLKK